MKKKNNKKLARNAIRARKAVKKRENEQNNSKQRKRIATRIACLIGCLLLVSALVVPCFAEDEHRYPQIIPPATEDIPMNKLYQNFSKSLKGYAKVEPIVRVYNEIWSFDKIVDFSVLNGGELSRQSVGFPIDKFISINNSQGSAGAKIITTTENYSNNYVYFLVNGIELTERLLSNCTITVEINVYSDSNDIDVFVEISNDRGFAVFEAEYGGYILDDGDGNTFASVILNNGWVNLGTNNSVSILSTDTFYIGYLSAVATPASNLIDYLFYGSQGFSPLSPYDMFEGYMDAYHKYYHDGYFNGWNDGFMYGYDYAGNTDDYERGYQDAIDDIDSGDFGRNFLGGIFTAPIDALNNFTLIDYELSDGEQVSITLGSIIGAALAVVFVIWFLKLFAGG